jgi:hypothetical protein
MSEASGMDGKPWRIDQVERAWLATLKNLGLDEPVMPSEETNEIHREMQRLVEAFRVEMQSTRDRVEWQVEGRHIPEPTRAEQDAYEQSAYMEWSAAPAKRSQGEAPRASWVDEWRQRWNVNAGHRATQMHSQSRKTQQEQGQKQGYSEGYGR